MDNLKAIEDLNHPSLDRPPVPWNRVTKDLLCGNKIHIAPHFDAFETIREEFPEPEKCITGNAAQLAVVAGAKDAIGRRMYISGPPGSGKSTLITEIVGLLMQAKGAHSSLILAPSKNAVDNIAKSIASKLEKLQKEGNVDQDQYIVRIQAKSTEMSIKDAPLNQTRGPRKDARSQDIDVESLSLEALSEIDFDNLSSHQKSYETKYKAIHDKRVTEINLSLGYAMLSVSGVVKDSPIKCPDPKRFADWRHQYNSKKRGTPFNEEQAIEYKRHSQALLEYTLQRAAAIVGTTTRCGLPDVLHCIEPVIEHLFLDGACDEREDNLLPFHAARFQNFACFWSFGDPQQFGPLILSRGPLVKQLGMSEMVRMTTCGFPLYHLVEQGRMVPDICNLANELVYKNIVRTSDKAAVHRRPKAQQFAAWIRQEINKPLNAIFIDVKPGDANQAMLDHTKSRYNDFYVTMVVQWVETLLTEVDHEQNATVCILTAYKAQHSRYLAARAVMIKKNVATADRLHVRTFDSSQGEQFDFVIMDILVPEKADFIKDPHRINVALTRAKNGLIILGTVRHIMQAKGHAPVLRHMCTFMKGKKVFIRNTDTLPASKYYQLQDSSHSLVQQLEAMGFGKAEEGGRVNEVEGEEMGTPTTFG